ncbi:hypothetical protein [uncultured Methanobrevibacter sp.]|uniref:hypothetical protein n=1 Tax=uncultured Methanobrevibacter sp. TaxID=253161 RepID=UPI002638B471|nr:hypothetical protein [uncultured Methanobrevibacter sp.]
MTTSVLFTQKLVSKDDDNKVNIEWKVENNSGNLIENVLALSQINTHDFGSIEDGEVKSIIFDVELPSEESLKMDFGEDAILPDKFVFNGVNLTYLIEGKSFKTKSNSIEI